MKLRTKLGVAVMFLAGLAVPQVALAYDWTVDANILVIEATYMPDRIVFGIDVPAGTCGTGGFVGWIAKGADAQAKIANINAVYAMLLTAKATRTKVRLYGNNSGCTVDYIHALPN